MQLGFYSLDEDCAATKPEEGTEVEEENSEEVETEEKSGEELKVGDEEETVEPEEDRTAIKITVLSIFILLCVQYCQMPNVWKFHSMDNFRVSSILTDLLS